MLFRSKLVEKNRESLCDGSKGMTTAIENNEFYREMKPFGLGNSKIYDNDDKTFIKKTLRLINEKINEPMGLACITFSRNAAREFKERFEKLNVLKTDRAFFGTIHSFCLTEKIFLLQKTS